MISGVLLNPLGYKDPGQLVAITAHFGNGGEVPVSVPEFLDLKRDATPKIFTTMSSSYPVIGNLTGADRPDRIGSVGATGDYFNLLGVKPLLGRTWNPSEETPGITEITVISYDLWQTRFGGKDDVLGKQIRIDDDNYTVIGVMPKGFNHPGSTRAQPVSMWYLCGFRGTPFQPLNRLARAPGTVVYGRLAPGVTLAKAQQSELDPPRERVDDLLSRCLSRTYQGFLARRASAQRHHCRFSRSPRPRGIDDRRVAGAADRLRQAVAETCNDARHRPSRAEITVRGALGATRGRLVRQLLTESVVIGLMGGVLGIMLAFGMVALVRANLPDTMPRATDVNVNLGVIAIGIGATILLTALFGVLPALTSTRVSLASSLRASAAAAIGSASRMRTYLVVGEIALAVLLLSGAGLFLRSFLALQQINPGFRTDHLLTLQMAIPYPNHPERGKYVTQSARVPYYTEVVRRVGELPNVEGVALASVVPYTPPVFQGTTGVAFSAEGAVVPDVADMPRAQFRVVGPGYFSLLRIPMHDGRDFDDGG